MYGGLSAHDRQEQRRTSLIAAGLELFGTVGYLNASVKRVCDEAGLTQRYFYESFPDRAALLGAVYQHCVDTARTATLTAAATVFDDVGVGGGPVPTELVPDLAETALGGCIHCLAHDRRLARIITIEVVGVSPELEKLRLDATHKWAELLLGFATGDGPATAEQRLAAIGLIGALTQLLVDWQTATTDPIGPDAGPDLFQIDAIHHVMTEVFTATFQRVIAPG